MTTGDIAITAKGLEVTSCPGSDQVVTLDLGRECYLTTQAFCIELPTHINKCK
jgi:hypothetical protein